MNRFAVWMTTVTTVLVLGGQSFGVTIPSLEPAGVIVGAKTPAVKIVDAVRPGTANTSWQMRVSVDDTRTAVVTDVDAPTATAIGASAAGAAAAAAADAAAAASAAAATAAAAAPNEAVIAASPICPTDVSGAIGTAPARIAGGGLIGGTTTEDLAAFAATYNSIRVANCLPPVPAANFRYDACMEDRLIWIAEDPSTDPASAWGHLGSVRSDGVASVGCDGNLAGGSDNSGATMASKWWESTSHRASLYNPDFTGATDTSCVYFAMTHGGVPDEPPSFTRAAARFSTC